MLDIDWGEKNNLERANAAEDFAPIGYVKSPQIGEALALVVPILQHTTGWGS